MARPRDTWTAYHNQLLVVNAHHERYCESLVADLAEFRQVYDLQSDRYQLLDDRSTKYQTETEEYLKVMIAITQIRAIFVDPIPYYGLIRGRNCSRHFNQPASSSMSLYAVIRAIYLELARCCLISVAVRTVYKGLGSTIHT